MPAPAPRRREPRGSERRILVWAGWLVLAVAVIGGALFAGSLVFDDDGVASDQPSITPLTPSTSSSPSPSGTVSSSTSPTSTPSPTRAGMTDFLDSYLAAVSNDPATAWGQLTPGFQRTSGGFADYRSFWAPISQARASNVEADPASRTISYDVRYTYADGHTTTDATRLTLRFDDGTYAISGEG